MESAENARDRFLACAKEHLLAGRCAAFGIRDMVEECGFSIGTFYRYFHSKDDLVLTVMDEDWARVLQVIDENVSPDKMAHENLRIVFKCISSFERAYRNSLLGALSRVEKFSQIERKNLGMLYERTEKIIGDAVAHGGLEATLDVRKAAYLTAQMAIAAGREPNLSFDDVWDILLVLGKCEHSQDKDAPM